MLNVKRQIQITLYVLVLISSLLLGLSLESPRLIVIAIVGATIGFVVTDLLRLFRIEGVLANIASIVILILAMKDFFPEDSTGKLVSVANLLVYLQTVLMFQEKNPRLNWQILILSLLQVVVGAIFTLDLEAGLLFLLYFFVVGLAMILQSVYTDVVDIERRNRRAAGRVSAIDGVLGESKPGRSLPVTFFDPGPVKSSAVRPMVLHLMIWIGVATLFTSVMFYLIPRHSKPWFGPNNVEVASTGFSKSVDLDERGVISQSGKLVFRVNMDRASDGQDIDLTIDPPYFRGLALSSLVIEDGKTDWKAPHDRVHRDVYQDVPYTRNSTQVLQTITLEETTDPLMYGVMPFFRTSETPREVWFCHEISALTRCKFKENIDLAPYKYQAATLLDANGRFAKSWPYISNTGPYTQRPMSQDKPQKQWLTQMDPARYPRIVQVSNALAQQNKSENGSQIELFRKFEDYFHQVGRFNYTLDFRNIERNEKLDPVEDFFGNHRSGHCELFASALTLMLRQQGIPARLVVGFHGAEYNDLTGTYAVRVKHAHAWVEAYLPPEECTPQMMESGLAGTGGAWMILDATPIDPDNSNGNVGDEAMDLARSVWDDYVLGMDARSQTDEQGFSTPLFKLLQSMNIEVWESEFRRATRFTRNSSFKYIVVGIVAVLFGLVWFRSRFGSAGKSQVATAKVSRFRRMVAGAISLISPGLGKWVMDRSSPSTSTAFYQRMSRMLAKLDLIRAPSQTHREFAAEVGSRFDDHPSSSLIQSTVREITELFNEVRFGRIELEPDLSDQIEISLAELSEALERKSLVAENRPASD